jgi:predicted nucleic acid-binding protein
MNAVDTNIWIYRYDSRDPVKQLIAEQLIDQVRPLVLIWQVGCEFIAASRKLAPLGFTEDDSWKAMAFMQSIVSEIVLPEPPLWTEAHALQGRFTLSFWDALLVAACLRAGVQTLYTENLGAPRVIDALSIVNPFLTTP